MIKHYVTFIYPGLIVANSETREVPNRDPDSLEIPQYAEGFQFFDREEIEQGGEMLRGKEKNHSEWHYIGRKMTLAEVKAELPDQRILISNMETNGYAHVVKTRRGSHYPLGDHAKVHALKNESISHSPSAGKDQ